MNGIVFVLGFWAVLAVVGMCLQAKQWKRGK